MKALIGSAVNFFVGETTDLSDDKSSMAVLGLAEVILTVVEPDYDIGAGGKMQRKDTAMTFRYTSSADGLEDLGKKLIGYAGMLRAFEKRIHIEPEDTDGNKS
jgi:hypothetical protein